MKTKTRFDIEEHYLVVTAFSAFIIFVSKKLVKALDFGNVIDFFGRGGPNVGTDFDLLTATLYDVWSEHGLLTRTTMNTCWNCDLIFGMNGRAPGSCRIHKNVP